MDQGFEIACSHFEAAETARRFSDVLEPHGVAVAWGFWIFLLAPGVAAIICGVLEASPPAPWYMLVGGLPTLLIHLFIVCMSVFNAWFLRDTVLLPLITFFIPLWLFIGFRRLRRLSSRQRESIAWRTASTLLYVLYAGCDLLMWLALLPL